MIIESVRTIKHIPADSWPFDLPPVKQLVKNGLKFERSITFLVGENGTGKSTIIEAIAESYGLDVRGGHGGRKYGPLSAGKSPLGDALQLDLSRLGGRLKLRKSEGFFLRSETAQGVFEHMSNYGVPGYGSKHLNEVSHGEGYIQVMSGRFKKTGLYLMDEPEAALSFTSQLALIEKIQELVTNGSQIICATHSPILTSIPGAAIFELSNDGIIQTEWDDLLLVAHWRRFLANPSLYV